MAKSCAAKVVLVDEGECDGPAAARWLSLLGETTEDLPIAAPDDPALLSRAFASTGSPKAFLLTHGNTETNVDYEEGVGEIEHMWAGSRSATATTPKPTLRRSLLTAGTRAGDVGRCRSRPFPVRIGRAKEGLALGDGRKVSPEDLEPIYGNAPEIAERAVLGNKGAFVTLADQDRAKLVTENRRICAIAFASFWRKRLTTSLSGAIIGVCADRPPIAARPTREIPAFPAAGTLCRGARRRSAGATHALSPKYMALLRDPTAEAVWDLLRERYSEEVLDLDIDLLLDLNADSFD